MSDDEIRKVFSVNLTRLLAENGKTQKDLVDYTGISSSTVSNWCTGQKLPRADKIKSIANWLNVTLSDLLEANRSEKPPTYDDMIKVYTRGKNNLTQQEKIRLAQIILSDED